MVQSTSPTSRPAESARPRPLTAWHGRRVSEEQSSEFLQSVRSAIVADWVGLMEGDRVLAVAAAPRNARAVPALSACPRWAEGTLEREGFFVWSVPDSRTGESWIAVRVSELGEPSNVDASPALSVTGNDLASPRWLLAIWKYGDARRSRMTGQVAVISGVVCLDQSNPAQDLVPTFDPAMSLLFWASTRLQPPPLPVTSQQDTSSARIAIPADEIELEGDLAALLELTGFLQSAPSLGVALQLLAGHLGGYLGATSVWVALDSKNDRPLFANGEGLIAQPPAVLLAACDETRLREASVALPEDSAADRIGSLALRSLAREQQWPQLLSTYWPLSGTEASLVVTIGWREASPTRRIHARRFLEASALPVASALGLQLLAHESFHRRLLRPVREIARSRPAIATLAVAAALLVLMLLPVPDPVPAETQLEPMRRRLVASPFEARLAETLVRPGDVVTAGQTLARLDERDLRGELDQLSAAIHKAATERDGHLSQHEPGLAELDRLEMQRLMARHGLVESRLEQLDVTTPIAGLVVTGDLDQALGAPVKTGEMLFEIAPLDVLRAELLIKETDRGLVRPDQKVRIRLDSLPQQTFEGTIRRIRPRAEARHEEYGFVAELELTDPAGQLRPGMRGTAQIDQPWRPLAVRLFRRTWQTWQSRFGI